MDSGFQCRMCAGERERDRDGKQEKRKHKRQRASTYRQIPSLRKASLYPTQLGHVVAFVYNCLLNLVLHRNPGALQCQHLLLFFL